MNNTGIGHFFRLIFQNKKTVEADREIQFMKDIGIDESIFNKKREKSQRLFPPEMQLEHFAKISFLDGDCPSIDVLKNKGFVEVQENNENENCIILKNAKTGESMHIYNNCNEPKRTRCVYENNDILHSAIFDKNGRLVRGEMQMKLNSGWLRRVDYVHTQQNEKILVDLEDTEYSGEFAKSYFTY